MARKRTTRRTAWKPSGSRLVKTAGTAKLYKDPDWGEYVVVPCGSQRGAYHTDDRADALDTLKLMGQRACGRK